ncbi:MAG: helix-turn-helix transcriptional regulator [Bacteroidales bacterium]|jgi:transcriptional regulator with XRE-family HTH domain
MNSRIQLILKTKNISASKFADEIGVQRSSISHILSGRNNPSLDFIQKILKRFPDINSDWILTGKGSMYIEPDLFNIIEEHKTGKVTQTSILNDSQQDILMEETPQISDIEEIPVQKEEKAKQHIPVQKSKESVQKEIHTPIQEADQRKVMERTKKSDNRKIDRIVIFYSDKSCIEYFPE